jgi:hypothetical protein
MANASERLWVLAVGFLVGAMFATLFSFGPVPQDGNWSGRFFTFAVIMGGPIWASGAGLRYWFFDLGWIGLLLIPAHPIKPHVVTVFLTAIGLAFWFFAGFLSCATLMGT